MGLQRRALKLAGDLIPRMQRRIIDQRSEPRYAGIIDCVRIMFRGREHIVQVINISTRGMMIESQIMPRIGETVLVQFDNCPPVHGIIRWVRNGRMGLNFTHEIVLELPDDLIGR